MSWIIKKLRIIAIFAWVALVSVGALLACIVRWGDLNLDRGIARALSWGILKFSGIECHFLGLENLEATQPCVYVSNHQSGLDIGVFGKQYPSRTIVIGKKELWYIPFFGVAFYAAGNIMIDRKNKKHSFSGIQRAVEKIRNEGASIWIMPEGTRNTTGEGMLPFKKGAFHMAISAQVPIVPLVASSYKPIAHWGQGMLNPGIVQVRVLTAIQTTGMTLDDVDRLSDEVRAKMLEAFHGLATQVR